jgi:hypothetical protein
MTITKSFKKNYNFQKKLIILEVMLWAPKMKAAIMPQIARTRKRNTSQLWKN